MYINVRRASIDRDDAIHAGAQGTAYEKKTGKAFDHVSAAPMARTRPGKWPRENLPN